MSIIPQIFKDNLKTISVPRTDWATNDQSQSLPSSLDIIGTRQYADVYIKLTDENGYEVAGNYASVSYQESINGMAQPVKMVQIPGSLYLIGEEMLIEDTTEDSFFTYDIHIVGTVTPNISTYTPPGICDAKISTISINKKESTAGAHDGQITISASSTHLPLQYSLDGSTYQSSSTFSQLAGGAYTAYIEDATGCTDILAFNLGITNSLLTDDPTVALNDGNSSRWNAAFNPVVFTYQRKDFEVTSITPNPATLNITVTINGVLSTIINGQTVSLAKGDLVYLNAGPYNNVYQVLLINANGTLVLNQPYLNSTGINISGFMNIDKLRPYYKVKTRITYQSKLTSLTEAITCTHRPNNKGLVRADLSSFLQSLLRAKDDSDFTQTNFRDDNLSASYTVSYAEEWDGQTNQ
ncbi:hypothetical protein HH214_04300 [Mucilaginibacter robiniae]|uniref:Uncharacterized protein n=1 Tax=Mucilaginibacter robiniae TaxID=2728022 RepID=A0A7L5E0T9_9SPHI|nr:hypothetical protein [Mucilaginibacter robiniae]QJD95154.1 hypothetical protein HH214_04300 [Mucilaginibacter robiniae]